MSSEHDERLKQMANKIRHSGIVESAENGIVHVRILQSSACSGCKVSGHCNASEQKEKVINVRCASAANYAKGDNVTITADTSVGFHASLYGYVFPLFLMVATLTIISTIMKSEVWAALGSLAILIPYYIILYLCREKINRKLTFELN